MHRITDKLPNHEQKVLVYEVYPIAVTGPCVSKFIKINDQCWALGCLNSFNYKGDGCQVWWTEVPEAPLYEV